MEHPGHWSSSLRPSIKRHLNDFPSEWRVLQMQTRHHSSFALLFGVMLSVILAACGGSSSSTSSGSSPGTPCKNTSAPTLNLAPATTQLASFSEAYQHTARAATALKNVSIGFGYIPDIQFSPFYVAQSKGYYQSFGLNVTFHHGFVTDVIVSMVNGNDTFFLATGDEELVARSKNRPVVDVATIYQRYPVSLIVPATSSICTLPAIKAHTLAYPRPFVPPTSGL